MAKVRCLLWYSGRVQGVGFRATTRRLATGYVIEGYVRNLDDGRVEVLVEGEPNEIDGFLAAIDQAFLGKIHHKTRDEREPGETPISGFLIND